MPQQQASSSFADELAKFRAQQKSAASPPTIDPSGIDAELEKFRQTPRAKPEPKIAPWHRGGVPSMDQVRQLDTDLKKTEGWEGMLPIVGGVAGGLLGPGGAAAGAGLGETAREYVAGEGVNPLKIGGAAALSSAPSALRLLGPKVKGLGERMWMKAADTANRPSAQAAMSRGRGALTRANQQVIDDPATFNTVPRPSNAQIQTLRDDFAHGVQRASGDTLGQNIRDIAIAGGTAGLYSPEAGAAIGLTRLATRPANLSRLAQGTYSAGRGLQQTPPNIDAIARAIALSLMGGK